VATATPSPANPNRAYGTRDRLVDAVGQRIRWHADPQRFGGGREQDLIDAALKELRIAERSPDKRIEPQARGGGQVARRFERKREQQTDSHFVAGNEHARRRVVDGGNQ
jgi:hypothetical protein